MTTSATNVERARQRDLANKLTGTFWCVGSAHDAPLRLQCRFHGKAYCKPCRKLARERMRAVP